MNRITIMFLCLMLCLIGTTVPADAKVSAAGTVVNRVIVMTIGSKILKVDDVDGEIDAAPQIKWGRTFSPTAPIINALGGTIGWDARTRRVTIVLGTKTIVLTIGSRYAVVNGKRVSIDSSPDLVLYVQAGRTMLPVRFIAEQFGALVTWTSTLQRVTLALKVTSPALPLTQRVVSFTTSDTRSTFLTLLADESVDVIEMAAGTYHLPCTIINIDRTRPVVVRPAAGATVVFSGGSVGNWGQFQFGNSSGTASNITMEGFTFDGYTLDQIGIIWIGNAHNITLNNMVVQNSHCNGTRARPYHSWALYISYNTGVAATNITANNWTVVASARGMSALTMGGNSHITATGWSVAHAYYAVYASADQGPNTDFILNGWTITDTGNADTVSDSVHIENASGIISNMHATASGGLVNVGTPTMTDGGGNSM